MDAKQAIEILRNSGQIKMLNNRVITLDQASFISALIEQQAQELDALWQQFEDAERERERLLAKISDLEDDKQPDVHPSDYAEIVLSDDDVKAAIKQYEQHQQIVQAAREIIKAQKNLEFAEKENDPLLNSFRRDVVRLIDKLAAAVEGKSDDKR